MFNAKSLILEIATIALVLLGFYFVGSNYAELPDKVAVHWDFYGEADRWDSPTQLFLLPAIGLFLFVLLTILGFFPSKFKYPVAVSDSNRDALYKMGLRTLQITKLLTVAIICYITYGTVQSALGDGGMPNMIPVVIFVLLIVGLAVWATVRQKKIQTKTR